MNWQTLGDAPESSKYHGGYDPSDPPQGEHYCEDCSKWDNECVCFGEGFDDEAPNPQELKNEETGNTKQPDRDWYTPRAHRRFWSRYCREGWSEE